MLVMQTTKDPANPLCEFISSQKTIGLDHFPLAVNPFRLYRVQPRTLLGQQAADNPHSISALFDLAVVPAKPTPHLTAYVPARVVPDQKQSLLAKSFELFATPLKESGRYSTDGPAIHEAQPRALIKLRQVESVAGDGFRIRVVFSDRLLDEDRRLSLFGPQLLKVGKAGRLHQHSSSKP